MPNSYVGDATGTGVDPADRLRAQLTHPEGTVRGGHQVVRPAADGKGLDGKAITVQLQPEHLIIRRRAHPGRAVGEDNAPWTEALRVTVAGHNPVGRGVDDGHVVFLMAFNAGKCRPAIPEVVDSLHFYADGDRYFTEQYAVGDPCDIGDPG